MERAPSCPARLSALLATLALVVLSFNSTGPAAAVTPGLDRGNSQAAHERNAERKSDSGSAATTSTTTTTGGDDVAASRGGQANGRSDHSKGNAGTSGKHDEPQPLSNADQNAGGANGQCPDGPYCSTRDGSASKNGNGGGKAKGKPCAGCVGKADNKNPPGQMPGPQDRNNGYECDGNNGIGKSNPAHTGCPDAQPPTEEPTCPDADSPKCEEGEPECVPTPANDNCGEGEPECVPTPANDNCGEGTPPGEEPSSGEENPPSGPGENPSPPTIAGEEEFGAPRPPTVAGVQQLAGAPPAAAPQAGILPATGAGSLTGALTTLGIGLLLTGGVLLGLRRRGVAPARR